VSEPKAGGIAGSSAGLAPEYLTLQEFADLLRVDSDRTIRRLVRRDPTVPMLRVGRRVLFPRERLLRWLQSREQGMGRPRRLREPAPPAPPAPQGRVVAMVGGAGDRPCADSCAERAPKARPSPA
jgi:excisionase family DNA binding protein